MRAAWVVIGVALVLASGCAQQDWIDRTLVTVDVTGTWSGLVGGTGAGMASNFQLELSQEGPAVKGTVQARATGVGDLSGPLQGTVAGDMFRFKNARGSLEGEAAVSGDEMTGQIRTAFGTRAVSLRRVNVSPPPVSPPR